jgi:hypothetical protein
MVATQNQNMSVNCGWVYIYYIMIYYSLSPDPLMSTCDQMYTELLCGNVLKTSIQ